MKKHFIIAKKGLDTIKKVEDKLTNRLKSGDNLSAMNVYEVKTVYEIRIKLVRVKGEKGE